jgi:hypothetical protein
MTTFDERDFASLESAAIAAPSADNRHVFRLKRSDQGFSMFATEDFLRAPSSRRVLGLISLGSVSQNLELRAMKLGLALRIQWQPEGGESPLLARITCTRAEAIDDPLEGAIHLRHTNRRVDFRGPQLSQAARQLIDGDAAAILGTGLAWLDAPARRNAALRLIRDAETERFRNSALHREMFDSIRFDVGWRTSAPAGLPPASLELPWFERLAFAALRRWPVQRAANLLGAHQLIGLRAAWLPCRMTPHLCAVTASGGVETAAINAGKLLQRVWLRATTLGMSFQVFAASPLYALSASSSICPDKQMAFATGWSRLCVDERPYVVFRLGHARPPTLRASRPLA